LTDPGRVRAELDAKVRYELFKDFFLGLYFFDSFDSRSPGGGGSQNDFGTTLSLGWSF
jgi:hypothetical protein